MSDKNNHYEPLRRTSESSDDTTVTQSELDNLSKGRQPKLPSRPFVVFAAALFLISNGIWAWLFVGHHTAQQQRIDASSYYALNANPTIAIPKSFHWDTPFSDDNKTISSPLWASIFPSGAGLVTVDNHWAAAQKLPLSKADPTNTSHSVYFVAALHQIHCLTVIRASLFHFQESKQQTVPWKHVMHCLDSLRQAVVCKGDSTLLYTEDGGVFGNGQVHTCCDWEGLVGWAEANAFVRES